MLILTHNVHDGGNQTLPYLLAWADEHRPDLITLQEVTWSTVEQWRKLLIDRNYHVRDTFELATGYALSLGDTLREDGLLIAARWPITVRSSHSLGIQWPERILSVLVHHPEGEFEVHTTHVPNGSQGYKLMRQDGGARLEKKLETLEGVKRALTQSPHLPRLLTGDFNEPQHEHGNGRFTYWSDYRATPARYRARWRAACAGVFERLPEIGVRDIFRDWHKDDAFAFSWCNKPGDNKRRYDHLFGTSHFTPLTCKYLHEFREINARPSKFGEEIASRRHAALCSRLRFSPVLD